MLDSSLTEAISIETYEIHIFRSNFTYIHVYLCRVSSLTTLDIYKDYFKGRQKWCKVIQLNANWLCMQIVTGDKICLISSYSLWKLLRFCAKGFVTKELLDFHCLMNWRTLQPTSSSSWCVSHVRRSMHHWLVTYWGRVT